ncbi:type III-B CRISPR module RAMP protein Cmr4 [Acidianus sulfidivorans JP7]|uniref:Type III-B CRISPR module RAMP protein Cmr4 n=1 Tax=Acidianus sulfidivorans JP7 TaxID=619593 RepID=A0A2U9IQ18_9CREN|nr:type III-B CRISPR module RAMP protein Cmr4 [Acidianus sulfidivorans]AWR98120.1 type III-B CRISPR module RAMP protein Cmr4 [Acidianus sulfidivorans JP7]
MILVYAVTPIHVGAGRSVGIVDLPIQRDSIGYPVIFSSSFKGALKSYCANGNYKEGRIDCQKAKECCCLFGSEPVESEMETGRISLTDLIPFAVPVPSVEGYSYLTSYYLLKKIKDILSIKQKENSLLNLVNNILNGKSETETEIFLNTKVNKLKVSEGISEDDDNSLSKLGSLSADIYNRLVISYESIDTYLFDRATIKVTRNRILLDTKTVQTGALWTEEYLPEGTILVGDFMDSKRDNVYCKEIKNPLETFKKLFDNKYINLGGKETIGKGIVKIKVSI